MAEANLPAAPLACSRCGRPFGADDVDFSLRLARCRGCDAVLPLVPAGGASARAAPPPAVLPPRPPEITESREGGGLVLSFGWRTAQVWFMVIFCIFWDGFLVMWYGGAFASGDPDPMMVLFPLIHVAVGVGLTTYTAASLVNTTTVRLRSGRLTVTHGPVPWPGAVDMPTSKLAQLFVHRRTTSNKNGVSHSYDLNFLDTAGVSGTLVRTTLGLPHARYLERRLEQELGITNEAVPDEA